MIGASSFFELAVAAALALFSLAVRHGTGHGAGVLVEVPLTMALGRIADNTHRHFSPA